MVQFVPSWHSFHHLPSTSEPFHASDCWALGHHLSRKRAVFQKGSTHGAKKTKRTSQGIIGKPGLHIFFSVPEPAVFPCIIIPWKSLWLPRINQINATSAMRTLEKVGAARCAELKAEAGNPGFQRELWEAEPPGQHPKRARKHRLCLSRRFWCSP